MTKINSRKGTSVATLSNFGIQTGSGILHPALQNRFRVLFQEKILTIQTTYCSVDMGRKYLHIGIEQPSDAGDGQTMMGALRDLQKVREIVTIELLDANDNITVSFSVSGILTSWEFHLDYSESSAVLHEITISF